MYQQDGYEDGVVIRCDDSNAIQDDSRRIKDNKQYWCAKDGLVGKVDHLSTNQDQKEIKVKLWLLIQNKNLF